MSEERQFYSLAEAGRAWNLSVTELLQLAMAGTVGLASLAMTWPGCFVALREIEFYLNRLNDGLEPGFELRVPAPEFERYSRELKAEKTGWIERPRTTKTETIKKYQTWQARINELGMDNRQRTHADLCKLLATEIKATGATFKNILRHTRKPRS